MKALHANPNQRDQRMSGNQRSLRKLQEEFVKFERTMEELHFLKLVADDLKSFRKMIELKKYD